MPTLLLWLFGVVADLALVAVGWFTAWMAKRGLIMIAVATLFATLVAGFYTAINAAVSALSVTLPTYFAQSCDLFLPSNCAACVSAYCATVVARFVYDQGVILLQLRTSAVA